MLNKNTDCYALASYLIRKYSYGYKKYTIMEDEAKYQLGIKALSQRISDLKQLGLPLETVFKKVTKRNGRVVKVIDYYQIKKGKIGVYKKRFKELRG